jgi:hypothetical protein
MGDASLTKLSAVSSHRQRDLRCCERLQLANETIEVVRKNKKAHVKHALFANR